MKRGDIIKEGPYTGFEVLSVYSRADALSDGTLVDVSSIAKEAGIVFPVAVTRAVWARYVEVPEGVVCQDENGRLWDVIWMLRNGILRNKEESSFIYNLYVRNDDKRLRLASLKAFIGPGDNMEPVITVMLPEED